MPAAGEPFSETLDAIWGMLDNSICLCYNANILEHRSIDRIALPSKIEAVTRAVAVP
jgi:hypothetical protein